MTKLILDEPGSYSRWKKIWSAIERCDLCNRKKVCLCFDSSDGEYSTIAICRKCFEKGIDDYANDIV